MQHYYLCLVAIQIKHDTVATFVVTLVFYCKLVMAICFWFCAITAIYFRRYKWRQLSFALFIHWVVLSLFQPNRTDRFTNVDRNRTIISWVFLYNSVSKQFMKKDCKFHLNEIAVKYSFVDDNFTELFLLSSINFIALH